MQYRTFEKIDKDVSLLGMGCMRFPTYGEDKTIDEAKTAEMFDYAIANGINYFDTAWGNAFIFCRNIYCSTIYLVGGSTWCSNCASDKNNAVLYGDYRFGCNGYFVDYANFVCRNMDSGCKICY